MAWDQYLAQADQAVAAFFDTETFTANAYKRGAGKSRNDDPVPDPDRPAFVFNGSFDLEPSVNAFGGSSRSSRSSADDVAPRHVSEALVSALVTGMTWRPTPGDRLTRLADGRIYVISLVDGDGTDRVIFQVNRGN